MVVYLATPECMGYGASAASIKNNSNNGVSKVTLPTSGAASHRPPRGRCEGVSAMKAPEGGGGDEHATMVFIWLGGIPPCAYMLARAICMPQQLVVVHAIFQVGALQISREP